MLAIHDPFTHQMRNRLKTTGMGLGLVRLLQDAGLTKEASTTFNSPSKWLPRRYSRIGQAKSKTSQNETLERHPPKVVVFRKLPTLPQTSLSRLLCSCHFVDAWFPCPTQTTERTIMAQDILKFPPADQRHKRGKRPAGSTEDSEPTILQFPSVKEPSNQKRAKQKSQRKASE